MGLAESRLDTINFDEINHQINCPVWTDSKYKNLSFNHGGPFLNPDTLQKAGQKISDFFKNNSFTPHILEVCAGNGNSSFIILQEILKNNSCTIISTDLYNYPNQEINHIVISDYDSGKAVDKFGDNANTLLLISPPPGMYADYFAISKWEKLIGHRYIIYIGELGASDGGEGMYRYMLESKIWKLELRYMLSLNSDYFGGNVEKELFIFSKMN
jgi:hypothetical protein